MAERTSLSIRTVGGTSLQEIPKESYCCGATTAPAAEAIKLQRDGGREAGGRPAIKYGGGYIINVSDDNNGHVGYGDDRSIAQCLLERRIRTKDIAKYSFKINTIKWRHSIQKLASKGR